jgi:hypothetical protein
MEEQPGIIIRYTRQNCPICAKQGIYTKRMAVVIDEPRKQVLVCDNGHSITVIESKSRSK